MKTPKPLDLPPARHTRLEDVRAFFAEENQIKRDEIAAHQLTGSKTTLSPREKKLQLSDAKKIFREIKITPEPNFRQVRSEEDSLQS
jgi:hypothetical protein